MNGQNDKNSDHEFCIKTRREMSISGVSDVISFDENDIHLITCCGEMFIEGKDMHIDVLDIDRGAVSLSGKIDAVYYSEEKEKERRGFFGKMIK